MQEFFDSAVVDLELSLEPELLLGTLTSSVVVVVVYISGK